MKVDSATWPGTHDWEARDQASLGWPVKIKLTIELVRIEGGYESTHTPVFTSCFTFLKASGEGSGFFIRSIATTYF